MGSDVLAVPWTVSNLPRTALNAAQSDSKGAGAFAMASAATYSSLSRMGRGIGAAVAYPGYLRFAKAGHPE